MQTWLSSSNLRRAANWLWGFVLLTLPVTTFRYIPGPLGRTLVKPLALYPLALLIPVLFLIFLRNRRIPLPANFKPLLVFMIFALATSFVGVLYAPIPLREATFDDRVVRGWISLVVGLVFFFVAFWMNRDEADLQRSLKWIYAGLGLTLVWSLVQAVAINSSLIPRHLINEIQLIFSDRPLLARRISGFAYEPAWLADQIVAFYMPWLFAAILVRRPLTARRWLERLLFLLALVVLVFTYSRGGLASAFACMAIIGLLMGRATLYRAWSWFVAPFKSQKIGPGRTAALSLRTGLLTVLVVSAALAFSFLSRYQYFASVWQLGAEQRPLDYIVNISAGPRLAYAMAGYKVYESAPLTGVGMGVSGLYLLKNYPEWSFVIPEIARQLSPDSNLIPNTKSFYVRLLAETGLPGFWFFIVFMLSFLALLRRMFLANQPYLRFVAIAGLFAWLALALRDLTQDSFTFPIMWVILGIIAGLYPVQSQEIHLERDL
jgi:hypothetical protein